jgi:hypothetical protein
MEPSRPSLPLRAASGALDGAAATLAMTGVLFAAQRAGWLGELPPRRITRHALGRATPGPIAPLSRRQKSQVSAATHVGFGAAAGALYEVALGRRPRRRAGGALAGAAFGLAVWLVSYGGWVPAFGILPPPHRDRPPRQAAMVLAHLVYGAALGALASRRARRAHAALPAPELAEVPSPS